MLHDFFCLIFGKKALEASSVSDIRTKNEAYYVRPISFSPSPPLVQGKRSNVHNSAGAILLCDTFQKVVFL
jgi:hypothetical protein